MNKSAFPYYFENQFLPRFVYEYPDEFCDQLTKYQENFIIGLWIKISEEKGFSYSPEGITTQKLMTKIGFSCFLIKMPEPKIDHEFFYLGVLFRKKILSNKVEIIRFITLEKGINDTNFLCEWNSPSEHINFGKTQVENFNEFIIEFCKLIEGQEKSKGIIRIENLDFTTTTDRKTKQTEFDICLSEGIKVGKDLEARYHGVAFETAVLYGKIEDISEQIRKFTYLLSFGLDVADPEIKQILRSSHIPWDYHRLVARGCFFLGYDRGKNFEINNEFAYPKPYLDIFLKMFSPFPYFVINVIETQIRFNKDSKFSSTDFKQFSNSIKQALMDCYESGMSCANNKR